MGRLYDVAQTLWSGLITYKTQREVVVEDVKIGLVHKATLFGLFIYLLFSIITSHAYMRKEAPAVSINSWNGGEETTNRLEAYRNGTLELPWYCNSSETEYVYGPSFTYFDNLCDLDAVMGEIYDEGGTSTSFVSYYQDTALEEGGTDVNAFIPDIELITLYFSHAFTSSLGVEGANVRTTIQSNDGSQKKIFEEGEVVSIKLQELLSMSGIDLNDRHPNSGGAKPTGNLKWPLWRMTGVSITLEMEYKNFRERSPFDFSKELIITASAVENVWTSRGQQIHIKRENGDLIRFQRYVQVLSVSFRPSGQVGVPNAFSAVINIGVSVAIFGVTKVIVDTIGKWILEEFYDKKMLDSEEWKAFQDTQAAVERFNKERGLSQDEEKLQGKRPKGVQPIKVKEPSREEGKPSEKRSA